MKRAIERLLVFPLSNLVATNQVELGDLVQIDINPETEQLMFHKQAAGGLISAMPDAKEPEPVDDQSKGLGATATRGSRAVRQHARK